MSYLIEHISEIVSGEWLCFYENSTIEHLLTDSRRLIFPGTTLFFALNGPRRKGTQFTSELYQRGVRNFVVNDPIDASLCPEANIVLVADVLQALQRLASFHRRQFEIPVIGITGSNGKTTVKEWLNQLLENRFHIVRSPRSYNSQIGVPLSVWQMNGFHELAIFEAGISKPGEMTNLQAVIRPTIGLFTNMGEAHDEGFSSRQEKIREKIQLFKEAKVVIFNQDDQGIRQALTAAGGGYQLFSWGGDPSAALVVKSIQKKRDSTTLAFEHFSLEIPFTDEGSIENVLACTCALLCLKVPTELIGQDLWRLSAVAMRLELKSGINGCTLINDSYSADIDSLKIALDFMLQQQQHPKRTVILSDILQSGKEQKGLYGEIARLLQQKKVDRLIGIGPGISSQQALFAALGETSFFTSADQFRLEFHRLHFRDETILLKGARLFGLEAIDRLVSGQVHQTVLEIDLNAIAANLKQYQQLLRPSTRIMAMVKAFSYGGGSFEIANLLQFHKVDYLAVAYADEAVELRKSGIGLPILVMSAEPTTFDILLQYQLEPAIYSFHLLSLFDSFLKKEGIGQFPVHVELETGMNRLGFAPGQVDALTAALKNASFRVRSVFSHLAASEELQQDAFTRQQGALFLAAAAKIQAAIGYNFLRHIANTAGIVRYPDLQLDMVRLGIGLYGIDSASSHLLHLTESATLKSRIAQIKHLSAGETVGYNRKGIAEENMITATVSIGYADGYPRVLGNGNGKMLVNSHFAPVIGSVCMDMTMIDITGIHGVKEGDEVTVFGKGLSVEQVARWAQTIPYEMLTGVSQRVKRIYFEE